MEAELTAQQQAIKDHATKLFEKREKLIEIQKRLTKSRVERLEKFTDEALAVAELNQLQKEMVELVDGKK